MGKDCACPFVVLVLVFTAVCDLICARCARWCVDTAHGHGFACLSVVLVLVCSLPDVWYADTAYGHGLRCLSVVLVLVCSMPWRFPQLQYFPGGRCPCWQVVQILRCFQ